MNQLNLEVFLSRMDHGANVIIRNNSTGELIFEGNSYGAYMFETCNEWEVIYFGMGNNIIIIDVEEIDI